MLEQRRAQEKGYITLKEAAELSSYSADYVGQLIRAGKIKGEQVYANVAWVTTPEEIQAYLDDKSRTAQAEPATIRFSQRYLTYGLYGVIGFLTVCILFLQYVLYVTIDNRVSMALQHVDEKEITEAIPYLVYE